MTARRRLLVGAAAAGLWLALANVGGANEPPAELNVVCVDSQGNVYQAASAGDCGRRTAVHHLPQDRPFLMCSDNRSGALRWVERSNGCTSRESLLTVPDSGPIYVCSRNKQAGAVLPTGLVRHVSDPGQCDPKAETPYVTPAAPVPSADTFHASEDELLEVPPRGVLANDFDLTGQPLTAHAVAPPSPAGSFLLRTDGSFRYDPRTLFDHLDDGAVAHVPFDYAADDGALRSVPARATIVVRGRNDVPVARPDAYDVPEDSVLTVPAAAGVLANDSDAETHPLSAVLVSGPAQGALTLNSDGSLRYDPGATFQSLAGGQSAAVTFTYLTRDGTSESSTATVTVTVQGVNDAPVVRSDQYTTDENTVLTVAAPGVLANDTDAENQALAADLVSGPTAGTLWAPLASDGSFAFDPRVAFDGLDTGQSATATFVYRAVDAQGGSAQAQVTITVVGVGLPIAVNDEVTTDEDTAVAVDVLANDARRGGVITAVGPALGSVQGPDSRQLLTYDPRARDKAAADQDPFDHLQEGTTGTDGFTYTITNAEGSVQGNVVVRVAGRNDAPVAVADAGYSVPSGQRLTVPAPGVLGNDTDAEGDPLAAVLVSPPARGRLTLNPDGSFVYEPADDLPAGQAATVTFSYRASDGRAESGTATATVQIQGVNHPPAVPAQELSVREDRGAGHVIGQVAFSDPDPGQSHSFAIVAGDPTDLFDVDTAGTLLLNRPDLDFETTPAYALTITVTDEAGASGSGAVTIRVVDVNEQGTTADDAYAAIGNTQLAAGGAAPTGTVAARTAAAKVLDNDSDPDGSGSLSVVVPAPNGPQATSQGGSYVMQPDGRFVYDPPAGFVGTDTFTYTATDGTNTTPAATVRITLRNRVWYVDNRLAAGTGTSRSPFSSLAPVADASGSPDGPCTGAGPTLSCDWVHLASTATPYQGPLVLEDGERLVGQGADLVVDGTLLIARAPTAPTIAFSTAAGGVELATGNDVRGVDVAGTGGPALHGDGFGTLTMAAGRLRSAGGPALRLTSGTLAGAGAPAATAAVLESTGSSTDGVRLDRVAGALSVAGATTVTAPAAGGVRILANTAQVTLSSVAVSDATGAGLEVVDNRGAVAVNGGTIARTDGTGLEVRGGADNGSLVVRAAVSDGSGRAVHVRCDVASPDCGAGAVQVAGRVSSTTGGVAVVDNRDGSTVVFSGGLDLSTGALPALVATDSAALEVSGSANVLRTTTGIPLDVRDVAFTPAGLTFRSISASGAPYGVSLLRTGTAGGLRLTGTGSPDSGGVVANPTVAGVRIESGAKSTIALLRVNASDAHGVVVLDADDIALERISVDDAGGDGIHAERVNRLAVTGATVQRSLGSGIALAEAHGASRIATTTVRGSRGAGNLWMRNATAPAPGVADVLTLAGNRSELDTTRSLVAEASGAGRLRVLVGSALDLNGGNTFTEGMQAVAGSARNGGVLDLQVTKLTALFAKQNAVDVLADGAGSVATVAMIDNTPDRGGQILRPGRGSFRLASGVLLRATAGGLVTGTVENNLIDDPNGSGIVAAADGGTVDVTIQQNQVRRAGCGTGLDDNCAVPAGQTECAPLAATTLPVGIEVVALASGGTPSTATAAIRKNTVVDSLGHGILGRAQGAGSDAAVVVDGNRVEQTRPCSFGRADVPEPPNTPVVDQSRPGDAIAGTTLGGTLELTSVRNVVALTTAPAAAIAMELAGGAAGSLESTDDRLTGGRDGVHVAARGLSHADVAVSGLTRSGGSRHGVHLESSGGSALRRSAVDFTVVGGGAAGPAISGTGGDGVSLVSRSGGTFTGTARDLRVENPAGNGIRVRALGAGDVDSTGSVRIQANTVGGSVGERGIVVEADTDKALGGVARLDAAVVGNTVAPTSGAAVGIDARTLFTAPTSDDILVPPPPSDAESWMCLDLAGNRSTATAGADYRLAKSDDSAFLLADFPATGDGNNPLHVESWVVTTKQNTRNPSGVPAVVVDGSGYTASTGCAVPPPPAP